MFERYTEKARRTIFFARYEASQYGSREIETEHLLLGLLREDHALCGRFLRELGSSQDIREEIEKQIKIGERISTSVEVPLSAESKHILNKAAEEAERLRHKHIGTEHLLLGILGEENCLAARVLRGRGLKLEWTREELQRLPNEPEALRKAEETSGDLVSLSQFVEAWGKGDAAKFARLFGAQGQFVDANGNMWIGPARIREAASLIFSAPGWEQTQGRVEDVHFVGSRAAFATLVWENPEGATAPNPCCVRMTVIFTQRDQGWTITRAQATGLQSQSRSAAG